MVNAGAQQTCRAPAECSSMQLNAAEMRTRRRKRQLTSAGGLTVAILVFQAVLGSALAASPEAPPSPSPSPALPAAPLPTPQTPQSQSSDRVTRNVAGSWAQMIEDYRKSANDVLFPYDLVDVMEKHNEAQVLKSLPKLSQGRAARNPDPRAVLLFLEKELDRARKGKNKVSMDADASLWDLDRLPRRLRRRRRQVSDSDQEPVLASGDESDSAWSGVASVGRQVELDQQGALDDNGDIPPEVVDRLSELNLSVVKPVLDLISTGDFQVDTPPPALPSSYSTADGGDVDSEWVVQQQPVRREVLKWVPTVPAADLGVARQRGQNTVLDQNKDSHKPNTAVLRETANKAKYGVLRSVIGDNNPEGNVAWETVGMNQEPRGLKESGADLAVNPKKYQRKKKRRKKLKMKKRIPMILPPLSNDDIIPTNGPLDENLSVIEEEPIIYNMPPIFQDILFGEVNDLQSTTPSPWSAIYIGGEEEAYENNADALPQDKPLTTPSPPPTMASKTTTMATEVKKPNLARKDSRESEFTGDKILDAYISKHAVHSAPPLLNGTGEAGPFEPLPTPLPDASAANMPPQSLTTSAHEQRDQSVKACELQANHSLLSEPSNNNVRTNAVTWLMCNDTANNTQQVNPSSPFIENASSEMGGDAVVDDEIKPIVPKVESVAHSSQTLASEFEARNEAQYQHGDKETLPASCDEVIPEAFQDKATSVDEKLETPSVNSTPNEPTSPQIREVTLGMAQLAGQDNDTESPSSVCLEQSNQDPSPKEFGAIQNDHEDTLLDYQTTTEKNYETTETFPYFATTAIPPMNTLKTDAIISETSVTTNVPLQSSTPEECDSISETPPSVTNVDFSDSAATTTEVNKDQEQLRTREESTTPLLSTSGLVFEEMGTELNQITTPKSSTKATGTTTAAPKKKKKNKKKKKGKGGWNLDFLPTTTTTTPAPWPYSLVSLAPFFRFPYGSVFRRTPRDSADGGPDPVQDDEVAAQPKPFPTRASLTGRDHPTVRPAPLRGTTSPTLPRRANAQRERLDTLTPPLPALPLKEYFSRFGLKDSDFEPTKSSPTLAENSFHPRPTRFYSKYWDSPSFKGNVFAPPSPKFQLPWNSNGLLGRMKRSVGLPIEDDPLPVIQEGEACDDSESEMWRLPRAPRERLRGLPRALPPLPPALEELIPRRNESEAEKAEREHKAVQRMIQLVNVMGSLQQFLSDRTRSVVKRLYKVITEDESNARM